MSETFASDLLAKFVENFNGDISLLPPNQQRFLLLKERSDYRISLWANGSNSLPQSLVKEMRDERDGEILHEALIKHFDFEDLLVMVKRQFTPISELRALTCCTPNPKGSFTYHAPSYAGVKFVNGVAYTNASERIPLTSDQMVTLFHAMRESQGANSFKKYLNNSKTIRFFEFHRETALLLVEHIEGRGLASIKWRPDDAFRKAVLDRLRSLQPLPSGDVEVFARSEVTRIWTAFMSTYERGAAEPKDLVRLRELFIPNLDASLKLLFQWWSDPDFEAPAGKSGALSSLLKSCAHSRSKVLKGVLGIEHSLSLLEIERSLFLLLHGDRGTPPSAAEIMEALQCPSDIEELSALEISGTETTMRLDREDLGEVISYLASLVSDGQPSELSVKQVGWLLRLGGAQWQAKSHELGLLLGHNAKEAVAVLSGPFPHLPTWIVDSNLPYEEIAFLPAKLFFGRDGRSSDFFSLLLKHSNNDLTALDAILDGFTGSLETLLTVISVLGPETPGSL